MISVFKHFLKKVKMKNITILLIFCWILWLSQIFAISTLLNHNGVPDITVAPSLVTLVEKVTDISLDNIEEEKDENITQATISSSTPSSSSAFSEPTKDSDLSSTSEAATNASEEYYNEIINNESDIYRKEVEEIVHDPFTIHYSSDDIESNSKVETDTEPPSVLEQQTDEESIPETLQTNETVEETQIPLFSEWAQKRMEEAEKELEQDAVNSSTQKKNTTTGQKHPITKVRVKNYASPDCGAKILIANPEATSTGLVLTSTKDEYLLSPCTSRIWFVVQLCEAIQAEIVDLANFELFSSSPKNFSISVSNRYPTREWSQVGQFIATDERNIQSFDLYPHLFGKYVRVDIHSHYNSEHFCPISLFRVYGTSEFEAFETENSVNSVDNDNDNEEEHTDETVDTKDMNIFKSASDAVMSIVKKAASFVKPTNNKTDSSMSTNRSTNTFCITPAYMVSCTKCSDVLSNEVTDLLACKQFILNKLLSVDLIRNHIYKSQLCANLVGIELNYNCNNSQEENNQISINRMTDLKKDYISHIFPIRYVAAMCNILAANVDSKTLYKISNITATIDVNPPSPKVALIDTQPKLTDKKQIKKTVNIGEIKAIEDILKPNDVMSGESEISESISSEIPLIQPIEPVLEGSGGDASQTIEAIAVTDDNEPTQIQLPPLASDYDLDIIGNNKEYVMNDSKETMDYSTSEEIKATDIIDRNKHEELTNNNANNNNNNWDPNDYLLSTPGLIELNEVSNASTEEQNSNSAPSSQQKVQSESVFLRLSNRVKALERNMTLSGQYLEELSRRYKKQVEELQTSFAKTIVMIEEQNKNSIQREQALNEENHKLRQQLEDLTESIFSWTNIMIYITASAFIQICIVWMLMRLLYRRMAPFPVTSQTNAKKVRGQSKDTKVRRKSTDGSTGHIPKLTQKSRRPSEEALKIVGTYADLLISKDTDNIYNIDPDTEEYDCFIETKYNKKTKQNRRMLVKRATSMEPMGNRNHSQNQLVRQDSEPIDFVKVKHNKYIGNRLIEQPMLDEDYEFYTSGSEVTYNEFVPDGEEASSSTPTQRITHGDTSNSSLNSNKKEKKVRRLSSPAFLKAPFSRSFSKKKSGHEAATGWEWYRLKKDPSSQLNKNNKKSKSESPEAKATTNNSTNTNGLYNNNNNSSSSSSAGAKNNYVKNSTDSIRTSSTTSPSSDKKQGSFRRILRKVF